MSGFDTLRTLFDDPAAGPPRHLSREDTESLFRRIVALGAGGGHTSVSIDSHWIGSLRWARNRITTGGETTDNIVRITRIIDGANGSIVTNKLDDTSLKLALTSVERMVLYQQEDPDDTPPLEAQQYLAPHLWSDATYGSNGVKRSAAARALVSPAVAAGVLAAGTIEVRAMTRGVLNTNGLAAYYAMTRAEYSVTVRNSSGTGSGWAGTDNMDWSAIDAPALSARALDKCLRSANPVAVEPGRYTVILEPQAVHDICFGVVSALDRESAENGMTAYTQSPRLSKLGQRIFDERITISTDPMDPACGYLPFNGEGYPFKATAWIERGVLKELAYSRQYALRALGHGRPQLNPYAYTMHGGPTSVDEMIATTARGLLMTRTNSVGIIDSGSLLSTGVTRDGLWLIENGRIKYAVKNMRFTESPMFMLNNLEQIGPATRVYASYPTVVPPLKVRDFNFTAMTDAV